MEDVIFLDVMVELENFEDLRQLMLWHRQRMYCGKYSYDAITNAMLVFNKNTKPVEDVRTKRAMSIIPTSNIYVYDEIKPLWVHNIFLGNGSHYTYYCHKGEKLKKYCDVDVNKWYVIITCD